jgi:hypothetical protein
MREYAHPGRRNEGGKTMTTKLTSLAIDGRAAYGALDLSVRFGAR